MKFGTENTSPWRINILTLPLKNKRYEYTSIIQGFDLFRGE